MDSVELLVGQWLPVRAARLADARTFVRKPQSIRRISIVSAESGLQTRRDNRPQSVESWSWYSSSQEDLMLISRKRANSLELLAPHPSTMLKATDSAELDIWAFNDPPAPRGNPRIARRTSSTSACALCHTNSRRKFCTREFSPKHSQMHRPFSAPLRKSLPSPSLKTTDNCFTNQLTTLYLDPLSPTPNFTRRNSAGLR